MTTPSSTVATWRPLVWAGAACLGFGWVALLVTVALGEPVPWPSWLMLIAVTGMSAANLLLTGRLRARAIVSLAMAALTVVAAVGMFADR